MMTMISRKATVHCWERLVPHNGTHANERPFYVL